MPSRAPSLCSACIFAVSALRRMCTSRALALCALGFPVLASAWPTLPPAPLTEHRSQARPDPVPAIALSP
eukprot:4762112-Pleurochrysis_carterae.AAC.1